MQRRKRRPPAVKVSARAPPGAAASPNRGRLSLAVAEPVEKEPPLLQPTRALSTQGSDLLETRPPDPVGLVIEV